MVKNLLSLALLSSMAVGAHAYDVDNFIYTRAAKYKVTAANLVKNGNFSEGANGLSEWTATDAATSPIDEVFAKKEDGLAAGKNSVEVQAGATSLTQGMFQVVNIETGGTYVVTLKVKGAEAGYTDLDQKNASTNYIFAYFNKDGALSTVDGTNLMFGEEGAAIENCYSFTNEDFTEMAFPVEAPAEGKIVIDLRGLAAGVEIAEVECHAVTEVTDERVAQRRLDWVKYILNGFAWNDNYEYFNDLKNDVAALEKALENMEDPTTLLENLEGDFGLFEAANLSNVLNSLNGGGEGDDSPNWMNWTSQYHKLNPDYWGNSGWTWSTNRWAHESNTAGNPIQIQWQRTASNGGANWDNIANLACKLDKGTYFYGVEGQGGMMTQNKDRWVRNSGYECAETQIFLGIDGAPTAADTLYCGMLPTTTYKAYINKYVIAENETSVNLGIRCNQSLDVQNGFSVSFANPVLYKVLVKGELTPEEKTYISNVAKQIETLEGRIAAAEEFVAATQTEKPWGKANLQKGIDEAKKRLEAWKKLDQDAILELMLEDDIKYEASAAPFYVDGAYVVKDSTYTNKSVSDVIMNAGVRYINNEFINVFNNLNAPLTDMPTAIATAESTLASSLYSNGDKDAYSKVIDAVKKTLASIAAATSDATMEADVKSLADAKEQLDQATEAFKKSAELTPLVTFDFENGYEKVAAKDEDGQEVANYVISSKEKNAQMVFADGEFQDEAPDVYTYALGYQIAKSKSDAVNDGNILVLGHFTNLLELSNDVAPTEDEVFRVDFTLHIPAFGNAVGNPEILVLDEQKDTIGGFRKGTWTSLDYTTFGIDAAQFLPTFHTAVGAGKDELKDCFELKGGSRVDYQLIFDFKNKTIVANAIQYYGGVAVCAVDAITEGAPVEFTDSKNLAKYISISGAEKTKNTGRRSSIDNLKIYKYKSTTTDIDDVAAVNTVKTTKALKNGQLVIKSAKGTFNAVGVQVK